MKVVNISLSNISRILVLVEITTGAKRRENVVKIYLCTILFLRLFRQTVKMGDENMS